MEILIKSLIIFIVLEHLFFAYIEMFSWEKIGKKAFGEALAKELFKSTKSMAANQGLYNLFLVAGLIWSFVIPDPIWAKQISLFFLSCILIAGVFGSFTVAKKILYIQALPATIVIILILIT